MLQCFPSAANNFSGSKAVEDRGRVVSRCLGVGLAFATVSSDGKWAGDTKNDRGRDDGLGDTVAGWGVRR